MSGTSKLKAGPGRSLREVTERQKHQAQAGRLYFGCSEYMRNPRNPPKENKR